jgi:hypothetical protein
VLLLCRVGAKLMKGEWEEAVRLIMQSTGGDRAAAAARQLYLEGALPG